MKLLILSIMTLIALPSFAVKLDRSAEMVNLLNEVGVKPLLKRQYQDADIICKQPKKGEYYCEISAAPTPNPVQDVDVNVKVYGNRAKAVSQLLLEFGVTPGKAPRLKQRAQITCSLPKRNSDKPSVCQLAPQYEVYSP